MKERQYKTDAEVAALASNNLFKHDDSQMSQGIKMGEPLCMPAGAEVKSITIPMHLAWNISETLVNEYNSRYATMTPVQRLAEFRGLWDKLKKLNCEQQIAAAMVDDDVRELTFRPTPEKREAYIKKHSIKTNTK